MNLVSTVSEVGVGQEFQIDLILDAGSQDINAAQGKIIFPKNLLELKEIADGNSIINLWVEKPRYVDDRIVFSGVIPGGFSGVLSPYYKGGKPGKVFSLVLKAKSEGYGSIEIKDANILLNDGQGTPTKTTILNFQFSISKQTPDTKLQVPSLKDADPPEQFSPEVFRDPNIFSGKWFLVFVAQDKVSGVEHYEIQETLFQEPSKNRWQTAQSPYVLKDQNRASYIFVKAIDRAGNERIVAAAPVAAPWYKKPLVDIIVGLFGLAVLLLVVRWLWRIIHKWQRI